MKKIIFVFVGLMIVLSFVFVNPVQASSVTRRPTTTQVLHKTATPQPTQTQVQPTQRATERAETVYYTGVWNSCMTITVMQYDAEWTQTEKVDYCKQVVKTLIDMNAYKYRNTDFDPLPADVVIP